MTNQPYHLLTGYRISSDGKETIQIEYRFLASQQCEIYTRIEGKVFHESEPSFFAAISKLLDTLPLNDFLVLNHSIPIKRKDRLEFALLEEWLSPYHVRNSSTVLYKLKLTVDNTSYETIPSTDFGGNQGINGGAIEQLKNLIDGKFEVQVCYFCTFLIEYNEQGGTDYRHDQLYCFREEKDLLQKIRAQYPNFRGFESYFEKAMSSVSALHSCSAFKPNSMTRL